MKIAFDQKKSWVTFGRGRFVCLFVIKGLIKKTLEVSVFEADEVFRPLDSKKPLVVESIPFDEHKMLSALKIIGGIDSGEATWLPDKYLSIDRSSKNVQDLEEEAVQAAFGRATVLLEENKDYEAALLNITASLLSEHVRKHPKYESRFLRKQVEAWVGIDNYAGAKKALLRALELYDGDFSFADYFSFGCIAHKLGNKKEAVDMFKKCIEEADRVIKSSSDDSARGHAKKAIEFSNQLINKLG